MEDLKDRSDFDAKRDKYVSPEYTIEIYAAPKGFGKRHVQVIMLFVGLIFAYGMRVNMSVGIVAMVNNSSNPNFMQYEWKESIRGIILSSFFLGYTISPFPAGILAQRFGPKIILVIGSFICSAATMFIPLSASLGWEYLCVLRVIIGLFQGCFTPCYYTLISKWIHPSERGFFTTFIYGGGLAGTIIVLLISGVIAASPLGWPSIFYITGALASFWAIFMFFYGCNSPADHPSISKEEQNFIESMPGVSNKRPSSVPWKHILTSRPFLVLLFAHGVQNWGFYTLLSEIPSYMNDVLEFDIKSNGFFSTLPYMVFFILSLILSKSSDFILNRNYLGIEASRKIFNTIAMWIPAVCLIALGYATKENIPMAVLLLTLAVSINSAHNVGFFLNHMDLSPNYAGVLMGFSHSIGCIMSLIGPLFVGFVVYDAKNPDLWRIFFFVTAGLFFFGNLGFVIFGKGSIQKWNEVKSKTDVLLDGRI